MNRQILLTDLAATYEELFSVPEDQRLTCHFGDYGQHFLRPDVTEEQLQAVCQKALNFMGLTEEEFLVREQEFMYRNNILTAMGGII